MRILIITVSLPYPPASGGALRVFGIIKGLAQAGHKIDLMCFGEVVADTPLKTYCDNIITVPSPERSVQHRIRDLLLGQADIARRYYSQIFRSKLLDQIESGAYDWVQFEGIESACYLRDVRQAFPSQRICFDTFNAEAELQRVIARIDRARPRTWLKAIYSTIQSRRISGYEAQLCQLSDRVIAVSAEDAQFLAEHGLRQPPVVIPSGIDVDQYAENQITPIDLPSPALIFTGKMDYRPNVDAMLWFIEDILPLIPTAKLIIVGQQPHPRLIATSQENTRVMVTGWVDDVRPYLEAATLYIAPLRMGSGTRLKLLEALATGCAIVATSIAAAGLNEDVRSAMKIADEPQTFAQMIRTLSEDSQMRDALRARAQDAVRRTYDWSAIVPHLLAVYEDMPSG